MIRAILGRLKKLLAQNLNQTAAQADSDNEQVGWLLKRDEETLGFLCLQGLNQPWYMCSFQPTETYKKYETLFKNEMRLLSESSIEEWGEVADEIDNLGLVLEPVSKETHMVKNFLLRIDEGQAWFRWLP